MVLGEESLVVAPMAVSPGFQAVGGQAARREEESLASGHGLEDFASSPERVVSEVSPIGVGTIKGDENWWRHQGAGSGRRSQSRRDRRCSSNTATSPSKISVEVGNNAIATASSRNRPVKATGRNLYATAPEHAEATSS